MNANKIIVNKERRLFLAAILSSLLVAVFGGCGGGGNGNATSGSGGPPAKFVPAEALDLKEQYRKSGLNKRNGIHSLNAMNEFAQYGNVGLRDRMLEAEKHYKNVDAFDKADAQLKIDAVQKEIAQAEAAFSQKTFYAEFPYGASDVKVDDNKSSFTMIISSGIVARKIDTISFPVQDVTGKMTSSGPEDHHEDGDMFARIRLFVNGNTSDIQELVRNSKDYRVKIYFKDLRHQKIGSTVNLVNGWGGSFTGGANADVPLIEIIKVR